jgi:hypothetical protein
MESSNHKGRKFILLGVQLFLAVIFISLGATTAQAQSAPPTGAGDFAGEMAKLVERAAELVPLIRDQVESPLMSEFENLSMWIAAIVMMLSFARVLRENDGGSKDLYYWVGRLVFCMILFGTGPTILNTMQKMGQAVVWDTPIKSAYGTQAQKFEGNYKKFLEAGFTVQGDQGPIGVLTDNESPVKSIDKALNPSSWNMPQVFTVVTVARGLMEFADLFLLLLGQFIMIALRLTSPFIIAIASRCNSLCEGRGSVHLDCTGGGSDSRDLRLRGGERSLDCHRFQQPNFQTGSRDSDDSGRPFASGLSCADWRGDNACQRAGVVRVSVRQL